MSRSSFKLSSPGRRVGSALVVAAAVVMAWWLAWRPDPMDVPPRSTVELTETTTKASVHSAREALLPLPEVPAIPPERAQLGERLFADRRLSRNGTVACISCHDLRRGGDDGRAISTGVDGRTGLLNAPSVFNAALNLAQFWDGRAATLEEQVGGPVHNPVEMDSNWPDVLGRLRADAEMVSAFARAYPDGLTADNLVDAVVSFERSLLTPGSRFDRYLGGDQTALNPQELRGHDRFLQYGCASCHQGAGIGGNMFQRVGLMVEYFKADRRDRRQDLGRMAVTGRESDRHVFKVPSLRNVALTAPYFHDGSVTTLDDAVLLMGRHQLGRELTPEEVADLVAFLRTLTGTWRGEVLHE